MTQNVIDERSRRGLAVRTSDADQAAVQKPERQLDFAPDRNFQFTGFAQKRRIGWNARTRHHEFLPVQNRIGVSAQL